jgi:hypothetical protein
MYDYLNILLLPSSELLCLSILLIVFATGRYRLATTLLFMSSFATLFNSFLKSIWQIPLPETANSTGWAFPSGHMHFACVFWLILAFTLGRKHFSFIIPMLMGLGYALVAKGYHYPIDIFPSAILGAIEAYYAHKFLSRTPCFSYALPVMAFGTITFFLNPQNFTLLSVSFGALLILGFVLSKVTDRSPSDAVQLTVFAMIFIYSMLEIFNFSHMEHSRLIGTLFSATITFFTWKILNTQKRYAN